MIRALLILLVLGAGGCKRSEPTPAFPPVRFVELFPNGADHTSPLVIAIHGRGDTPEQFAELWRGFPGKAHIALPQAPIAFGDGWSWFNWPPGMTDDALAAEVSPAADALWNSIATLAGGRKVIVTGFSQGGVLSFVLAARHPEQIRLAIPISGGAPSKLLPRDGAQSAPIYALHGSADPLIDAEYARSAVKGFKKAGAIAQLREYPGVGHTVTAQMREDLFARITAAMN